MLVSSDGGATTTNEQWYRKIQWGNVPEWFTAVFTLITVAVSLGALLFTFWLTIDQKIKDREAVRANNSRQEFIAQGKRVDGYVFKESLVISNRGRFPVGGIIVFKSTTRSHLVDMNRSDVSVDAGVVKDPSMGGWQVGVMGPCSQLRIAWQGAPPTLHFRDYRGLYWIKRSDGRLIIHARQPASSTDYLKIYDVPVERVNQGAPTDYWRTLIASTRNPQLFSVIPNEKIESEELDPEECE
jgi:hypothetical protein